MYGVLTFHYCFPSGSYDLSARSAFLTRKAIREPRCPLVFPISLSDSLHVASGHGDLYSRFRIERGDADLRVVEDQQHVEISPECTMRFMIS